MYVLKMEIEDRPRKGRVIIGHVSLSENWRARQLVQSLKKALNSWPDAPLPEQGQLHGLKLRVLVTAWRRPDGKLCESVAEFAAEEVPF